MVVFLFQSSALAPGASIAPISATKHTVVAALNSFISFFSPFAADFFTLPFPSVRRDSDLGGRVPHSSHRHFRVRGRQILVRSYMAAFDRLTQFEPANEELTVRGHMTEYGQRAHSA